MDKQQRAAIYKSYMSRDGPQNLGSVTWPASKAGSLKGLKFLSTGVLETITREDLNNLITECGGHIMSSMSKKLDYLIVGRDAGPVKLEKATEWELNQINEEDFLKFVIDKIESFDESAEPMEEVPKKGKKLTKTKPERPKKKTGMKGTKNKHESGDAESDESSDSATTPSPKKKTKG